MDTTTTAGLGRRQLSRAFDVKFNLKFDLATLRLCALSAALVASLLISAPAQAGSGPGGMGGALEITQLVNSAELLHQTSETITQTATQINQLSTMLQNMRSLSGLAGIAATLGIPMGALDSMIQAYGGVAGTIRALNTMERSLTRFGTNAQGTASFYSDIIESFDGVLAGRQSITQADMALIANTMNADRRERARAQLAHRIEVLQKMQEDYGFIQANAQQISSITGNVQGFQFIASQQSGMQRLLLDNKMAIQSVAADMQAERVERAEVEAANERMGQIKVDAAMRRAAF